MSKSVYDRGLLKPADIARLQRVLDDPTLYVRDRRKFDDTSAAIAKAHEELSAAEERWLELSEELGA